MAWLSPRVLHLFSLTFLTVVLAVLPHPARPWIRCPQRKAWGPPLLSNALQLRHRSVLIYYLPNQARCISCPRFRPTSKGDCALQRCGRSSISVALRQRRCPVCSVSPVHNSCRIIGGSPSWMFLPNDTYHPWQLWRPNTAGQHPMIR